MRKKPVITQDHVVKAQALLLKLTNGVTADTAGGVTYIGFHENACLEYHIVVIFCAFTS